MKKIALGRAEINYNYSIAQLYFFVKQKMYFFVFFLSPQCQRGVINKDTLTRDKVIGDNNRRRYQQVCNAPD